MASPKSIRTRALRLLEHARDAGSGFLRQNLVAQAQEQIAQLDPHRYRTTVQELQGIALSLLGRDGHGTIAHVSPSELVIPTVLQTPELMAAVARAAQQAGIDPRRFQVGSSRAKVNPRTGQEEFADPKGTADRPLRPPQTDDEIPGIEVDGNENLPGASARPTWTPNTPDIYETPVNPIVRDILKPHYDQTPIRPERPIIAPRSSARDLFGGWKIRKI